MLISYTIVGFYSLYDGAIDLQMLLLLPRSQCKVCDTQVTAKACGPHFKNIQGKNNLCFVSDNCVQFPFILAFWSFVADVCDLAIMFITGFRFVYIDISVNFSKLFEKEALIKRLKKQGKAMTKLAVSELLNEFMKLLNIPKVNFFFECKVLCTTICIKYPTKV